MGGYDWANGKSNGAVAAEDAGLLPATRMATRFNKWLGEKGLRPRISGFWITAYVDASEWHHSSKYYNQVNYYDEKNVRAAWFREHGPGAQEKRAARAQYVSSIPEHWRTLHDRLWSHIAEKRIRAGEPLYPPPHKSATCVLCNRVNGTKMTEKEESK